jgi:hypothetical protein
VIGAPFPYIVGIHSSFLASSELSLSEDAAKIFLDDNGVLCGRLGAPPALPDKRYRKLMAKVATVAPVYERRGSDWKSARLPLFDAAFTAATDSVVVDLDFDETDNRSGGSNGNSSGNGGGGNTPASKAYGHVDEEGVRAAFLNFFVAVFKSYRR